MKRFLLLLIALGLFSCKGKYDQYKSIKNDPEDYAIVPKPAHLKMQEGRFLIDAGTRIVAADTLGKEAGFLAKYP